MGKFKIALRLSIGDYRTMEFESSDQSSFEECRQELIRFLSDKPELVDRNREALSEAIKYEE